MRQVFMISLLVLILAAFLWFALHFMNPDSSGLPEADMGTAAHATDNASKNAEPEFVEDGSSHGSSEAGETASTPETPDMTSSHATPVKPDVAKTGDGNVETTVTPPVEPGADGFAPLGSGEYTVHGVVHDAAGTPIEGAGVAVLPYNGKDPAGQARTDKIGEFKMNVQANARLLLRAGAPGFAQTEIRPLPMDGGKLDIALQEGGSLSGIVRDAESGAPLADFTIAFGSTGMFRRSAPGEFYDLFKAQKDGKLQGNLFTEYEFHAEDGAYAIASLPRGDSVLLFVTAPGYLSAMESITGAPGPRTQDFAMSRGVEFAGVCLDAKTSQPVSGVSVAVIESTGNSEIVSQQQATDVTGKFALQLTDKGQSWLTRLRFEHERYGLVYHLAPQLSSTSVNEIRLSAGGKIRATVHDIDGRPVDGALIRITDHFQVTSYEIGWTDGNGEFESRSLRPSNYRVVAMIENAVDPAQTYTPAVISSMEQSAKVTDGQVVAVEFRLRAGVTVAGTIRLGGAPLAQATASLRQQGGWQARDRFSAKSNDTGYFEVLGVAPGRYDFTVQSGDVEIAWNTEVGETSPAPVVMDIPVVPVSVRIVGSLPNGNQPIATEWNSHQEQADYRFERRAYATAAGTLQTQLPEGRYDVNVRVDTREYDLRDIPVNGSGEVVLYLDDSHMATFHVTDAVTGAAVSECYVSLAAFREGQERGQDDGSVTNGVYHRDLHFEQSDRYLFIFAAPGYAPYGPVEITATGFSTAPIAIPLVKGSAVISGSLRNQQNEIPPHSFVRLRRPGVPIDLGWAAVDLSGQWRFEHLQGGTYEVITEQYSYQSFQRTVTLGDGETAAPIDILLLPRS